MKTIFNLLVMMFMSVACIKNRTQDNFVPVLRMGGVQNIETECAELSKFGKIQELIQRLKKENADFQAYVEKGVHDEDLPEMNENLQRQMDIDSKMQMLLKPEWNVSDLKFMVNWTIQSEEVSELEVKEIVFKGEQVLNHLIPYVKISQSGKNVRVRFTYRGSLLEYCQTGETLKILIDVKNRSENDKKPKYYNLHVNRDLKK